MRNGLRSKKMPSGAASPISLGGIDPSPPEDAQPMTAPARQNPFFEPWTGPFELPPFDQIRAEDIQPA